MEFFKRLGFYMVGMSIGIVFLAFFLKKKSINTGLYFCYLPNCRTLKDIRSKPMYYANDVSLLLKNKEIDTLDIRNLFTDGEVNFGNSDTKSNPCKTYKVEGVINNKEVIATVRNCRERATIEKLENIAIQ